MHDPGLVDPGPGDPGEVDAGPCECTADTDCVPADPCMLARCEPSTCRCVEAPRDCDDWNACTIDRCDARGICLHDPQDCEDFNRMTSDQCDADSGLCFHEPMMCYDNNPCTRDVQDPHTGMCSYPARDCDDQDSSTLDRCDPDSGRCLHEPAACFDGDPCTYDGRDPQAGDCIHTPKDCEDGDLCIANSCLQETGACAHSPLPIEDGDPCTLDACDPMTGRITHQPGGCPEPTPDPGPDPEPELEVVEPEDAAEVLDDGWVTDDGAPDVEPVPTTFRVDMVLVTGLWTCIAGQPCECEATGTCTCDTEPTCPCLVLSDDTGRPQVLFSRQAGFRGVLPGSTECRLAPRSIVLNLRMDEATIDAARVQIRIWQDDVQRWTSGMMTLDIVEHRLSDVEGTLSGWGSGLWLGPWDLAPLVDGLVPVATDFVLATPGIRDPDLQLHHELGGCGGTFGGEYGVRGAGYSWLPRTSNAFWFECAESHAYMHEWLHQLHWDLFELGTWQDLYHGNYPPCGEGAADPTLWFPDPHECVDDPDYAMCGDPEGCNPAFNEHILSVHWDPRRHVVTNHCRDGVFQMQWGEVTTDAGGHCP